MYGRSDPSVEDLFYNGDIGKGVRDERSPTIDSNRETIDTWSISICGRTSIL